MSNRERYHCMISTCGWYYERDSGPTSAELERALMFGPVDASLDRAARTNAILRDHFEMAHTLEEWVAEIGRERQRANKAEKELAEVSRLLSIADRTVRDQREELNRLSGVGVVPTVQTDSVIVKLSDGEVWVPEDCTVPDEVLRALNAPTRDQREGGR